MSIKKPNSQKILFFDTETTGLNPGNICQLSYIIVDDNIKSKNYYFKVNFVEPGAEGIHGLSVEKLLQLSNNRDFKDNFNDVKNDFDIANLLVGHNISFDLKFMNYEYRRMGHDFRYNSSLCTMKHFTNVCKIEKNGGYGYKWPRLEELICFFKITDREIISATQDIFYCKDVGYHDARFDAVATYLCYMKGLKEGLIDLSLDNIGY